MPTLCARGGLISGWKAGGNCAGESCRLAPGFCSPTGRAQQGVWAGGQGALPAPRVALLSPWDFSSPREGLRLREAPGQTQERWAGSEGRVGGLCRAARGAHRPVLPVLWRGSSKASPRAPPGACLSPVLVPQAWGVQWGRPLPAGRQGGAARPAPGWSLEQSPSPACLIRVDYRRGEAGAAHGSHAGWRGPTARAVGWHLLARGPADRTLVAAPGSCRRDASWQPRRAGQAGRTLGPAPSPWLRHPQRGRVAISLRRAWAGVGEAFPSSLSPSKPGSS